MFYGLIGYSQADMDFKVYDGGSGENITTKDLTFHGLTVGGGMEQDLGNGFSLKGEYRYTTYGAEGFGSIMSNGNNEYDKFDPDTHAFRLSLVYKFGHSDPVEEVSYKDIPPARPYK